MYLIYSCHLNNTQRSIYSIFINNEIKNRRLWSQDEKNYNSKNISEFLILIIIDWKTLNFFVTRSVMITYNIEAPA